MSSSLIKDKEVNNQYKIKYEKKRTQKLVSFNTEKESHLLAFADSLDFSKWVKQKIQEELNIKSAYAK